jgi:hypothetical protein
MFTTRRRVGVSLVMMTESYRRDRRMQAQFQVAGAALDQQFRLAGQHFHAHVRQVGPEQRVADQCRSGALRIDFVSEAGGLVAAMRHRDGFRRADILRREEVELFGFKAQALQAHGAALAPQAARIALLLDREMSVRPLRLS